MNAPTTTSDALSFTVKQGDTKGPWTDTLKNDGTAIDLTGATVELHIKQIRPYVAGADAVVRSVDVVSAAAGTVSYQPIDADVATAGDFQVEWHIEFADATRLVVPTSGYILLTVLTSLDYEADPDAVTPPLGSKLYLGSGGSAVYVSDDIDAFLQAEDNAAAREALGIEDGSTGIGASNYRIALLGDSITFSTSAGTSFSPPSTQGGWSIWANARLGGRFDFVYNGGVGGETTAQILARVSAVTTLSPLPGWCIVMGGTNDYGSLTTAQTIASLTAIADALIAAGIRPVLMAAPPKDNSPTTQGAINRALQVYVALNPGAVYVDEYARMVDPATGAFAAGMSSDGIHLNSAAQSHAGRAIYDALSPITAPLSRLISSNGDAQNLIGNGMFTGTGGSIGASAGSIATGWTSRMGANATFSKVARTDGIAGEWQQIALASPGVANGDFYRTFSVTAGDLIEVAIEFEIDASGANNFLLFGPAVETVAANTTVVQCVLAVDAYTSVPTSGVIRTLPVLVAATESLYCFMRIGGGGPCTMRLGRFTVKKLN